jgi:hypothetical protein
MKLLTLLLFVLTSAAFGQGIVYHRPEPPCSEQLKKASIQGVFIGDSMEQVSSDLPKVLWMDDPIDGTKMGIVALGLGKNVTSLRLALFKGKVYRISATYTAGLNWKDSAEMAAAVSQAWEIPDKWSDSGTILCKERSVELLSAQMLVLTDTVAENQLKADAKAKEDARKKGFKP